MATTRRDRLCDDVSIVRGLDHVSSGENSRNELATVPNLKCVPDKVQQRSLDERYICTS
jgi:hypothetical protein